MKSPFVIYENGNLIFFANIKAMEGYIEAVDIKNNEYEFFDSNGNEIIAELTEEQKETKNYFFGLISLVDCSRVNFKLSGKNYAEKLKTILLDFNDKYIKIEVDPSLEIKQIINTLINSKKVNHVH
jgi:hypothetical protein